MTPATYSIEMRREKRRSWFQVVIAVWLLAAAACKDSGKDSASAERGASHTSRASSPEEQLAPNSEEPPHPRESPLLPPSGEEHESQPTVDVDAARLLQTEPSLLVAVDLISCKNGSVLATMTPRMLRRLRHALDRAEVASDVALTPPAWEALLALRLQDGRTVFGQMVRADILRLQWKQHCDGSRAPDNELRLDERINVFAWLQEHLGPEQEKAYRVPKDIPPPPGLE
jgi:hypothetical protein